MVVWLSQYVGRLQIGILSRNDAIVHYLGADLYAVKRNEKCNPIYGKNRKKIY